MFDTIKKSTLVHLLFLTIFCLVPTMSGAVVALKTEIVSGNIVEKNTDHSVRLDNGKVYFPAREGLIITMQVGKPVTLRYVTAGENKYLFSEFAPGLNSLQESTMPTQQRAPRPQ